MRGVGIKFAAHFQSIVAALSSANLMDCSKEV